MQVRPMGTEAAGSMTDIHRAVMVNMGALIGWQGGAWAKIGGGRDINDMKSLTP